MFLSSRLTLAAALALAVITVSAKKPADPAAGPAPGTQMGPPRLDMLKDAFICGDGQGGYLLTGTAGTLDKSGKVDFDYNRGAPLWKSADLNSWTNPLFAWDRVEHNKRASRPKIGVWQDWNPPAGRIDGLMAQATTTPKLYQIGKDWYLLCALNNMNVLVQKSTSGKPDGPYDDYAYLVTRGGSPSLFIDEPSGGKPAVYLVFGEGWLAQLKDDLTELAEEPKLLTSASSAKPGEARLTLGDAGIALFKREGKYHALAARWQVRTDKPSHDAVLWSADVLAGPYQQTNVVLEGTGPVTAFKDAAGAWRAVSGLPCDGAPRIVPIPAAK